MAIYKETWTAKDELDYLRTLSGSDAIQRSHAYRGVAAYRTAIQRSGDRPTVGVSAGATAQIMGGITSVSAQGCKVVKSGRFVLQATVVDLPDELGKSVQGTSTPGKVVATSANATQGQLMIIGGGNDTDPGGIGPYYLVERV